VLDNQEEERKKDWQIVRRRKEGGLSSFRPILIDLRRNWAVLVKNARTSSLVHCISSLYILFFVLLIYHYNSLFWVAIDFVQNQSFWVALPRPLTKVTW
jgi:hypothetical protein